METETTEKTRNCLTWEIVNLTQLFNARNPVVKYIEDDSENHHHRLKSWKKVFMIMIYQNDFYQTSQKWNTYGKLPASGPGSTIAAAKNFMTGLENIVNFIKETLNKEKISMLGKAEIYL